MLHNYFKIAWRNLWKQKAFSAINILGLSAGIAFAMLISGYVWNELRVNKTLKNSDRQYILQSKWKEPGMGMELVTFGFVPKMLKEQYPTLVANYFRWDGITSNVSVDETSYREGLQLCDSTLLNMYGFNLEFGNAKTALTAPFSAVITTDIAVKYFGKTDVLGKTLNIESFSGTKHDFLITGVLETPVRNSVTYVNENNKNQIFIPASTQNFFGRNIDAGGIVGYIELQKGVRPEDLEKPLQQLLKLNTSLEINQNLKVQPMPLTDYYLDADKGLVRKMLYTLSCSAFFILLMAIINFINITISKSSSRMKEIGVRKVMGGRKKHLVIQFLTESILMVFIATIFALIIYQLFRAPLSDLLSKEIPHFTEYPFYYLFILFSISGMIGILSGIYPAMILSSLKSVDSLKGTLKTVTENVLLRKALVGFQFCTALIVFISAIIISEQIQLFFSADLGYNKDYIISAQVPRDWSAKGVEHMEMIRNEFASVPQVKKATLSYEIPNGNNSGPASIYRLSSDSTQAVVSQLLSTDEKYVSVFSIPLKAGNFFAADNDAVTDLFKLVINETEAKALGWKNADEAIGQQVKIIGRPAIFTIAGVTKDFHFNSMQQTIMPVTFLHVKKAETYRFLSFKLRPGSTSETVASLQKKWSVLLPGAPFEYTFMDDNLKKLYRSELQLKKATYTATALSIIIVLLGVLGLISLSIQNRIKEIGIRKVLGASVVSIVSLFTKEFLWVILLAAIIAFPVSYLLMHNWLNNYVYKITLTAEPFIFSVSILALVMVLLIVIQTMKAAVANPIKSLKA
jgi:putative ABC transport system permease protein